jgi:hypothetical protein
MVEFRELLGLLGGGGAGNSGGVGFPAVAGVPAVAGDPVVVVALLLMKVLKI